MTRTIDQDREAMSRDERIPDPPFEPTCPEVLERFRLIYTTMPEKLWHLQALRSLALQVAETEVTLAEMQKQMRGQKFIDWEGKPNALVGMITKQQVVLGGLYVKLRAIPEFSDLAGATKTTEAELKASQTPLSSVGKPSQVLSLIPRAP